MKDTTMDIATSRFGTITASQDDLIRFPGGIIGFHDIVNHPQQPYIEVQRFWLTLHGDKEEIIHSPEFGEWGGIGVLRAEDPGTVAANRAEQLERYLKAQSGAYHVPGKTFQKVG